MELRGSDVENADFIPPHYWDHIFTADDRLRHGAMSQLINALKILLHNAPHSFSLTLPRLARLLSECPYKDVHDLIEEFFKAMAKVRNSLVSISLFLYSLNATHTLCLSNSDLNLHNPMKNAGFDSTRYLEANGAQTIANVLSKRNSDMYDTRTTSNAV